ncbi:hypothetical protein PROFUN_00687 [Planoprotostelium fungivorum]|uniref:Epoxide hydrolase N-terminal domain-containing protein n=1 Tax=Planoprotostelium fungivorum TaxID=1890364 RepID=A0A2P6NU63_9EUKA|nr:hypothetical protein PROFUN_00687 [Planoprotostelium fungivorum]
MSLNTYTSELERNPLQRKDNKRLCTCFLVCDPLTSIFSPGILWFFLPMTYSDEIKPFSLHLEEAFLKDLRDRIKSTRFPPADLRGSQEFEYGSPLNHVKRIAEYWADGYDWRARESTINQLPMFTTKLWAGVEGPEPEALNIHFVHSRSEDEDAVPLLFIHGWPGSFLEVQKILPLLQSGHGQKFHIIAPSLPGYGFSDAPTAVGFGLDQAGLICHKLMLRLGYKKYVGQGGDIGAMVLLSMSKNLEICKSLKGYHLNMLSTREPTFTSNPLSWIYDKLVPYNEYEKKAVQRKKWFLTQGSGYRNEQSTKPQTLGYGLSDSPVGLLAWIYEKLHDWTDKYPWTDDEVLDWVMMYWANPNGPTPTFRMYRENAKTSFDELMKGGDNRPWGMTSFQMELFPAIERYARLRPGMKFWAQRASGGHFAATEKPGELVADIRKCFGPGGAILNVRKKNSAAVNSLQAKL